MSGTYKVEELYGPENSRYSRSIKKLSPACKEEAEALRELLEQHGPNLMMPHSKPLGKGVHELRGECDQKQLRIYYFMCKRRNSYVLASVETKRETLTKN